PTQLLQQAALDRLPSMLKALLAILFQWPSHVSGMGWAEMAGHAGLSKRDGQRLVRLRVVSIDGGRVPLWRVLVRTLLICLVIPAVVYDDDGRGVHDRLAHTRVVRVGAS
ncbi:MAG: hypothetical protein QF382_08490, partial [Acidimicrobiales bacterium]|nr:hypothetical protein [Acidimicrobiales bacterium]